MTFRAIQPNISFDMWFMSPKRSFMPKKRKSYWSVSEIDPSPPPPSILTDGRTDKHSGFKGYFPLFKIALKTPVLGAYLRNEPLLRHRKKKLALYHLVPTTTHTRNNGIHSVTNSKIMVCLKTLSKPLNLIRTPGQTDRQTDGRTTDKSVLEKLRCLSAGGAKNCLKEKKGTNFDL